MNIDLDAGLIEFFGKTVSLAELTPSHVFALNIIAFGLLISLFGWLWLMFKAGKEKANLWLIIGLIIPPLIVGYGLQHFMRLKAPTSVMLISIAMVSWGVWRFVSL